MELTTFSSIGLAAALLANIGLAGAAMPTAEEMWEIIQQQQREIDRQSDGPFLYGHRFSPVPTF